MVIQMAIIEMLGIKGVVLPPIRKSDNKCKWGAIDVDGEIYKMMNIKIELLDKVRIKITSHTLLLKIKRYPFIY